MVEQGGSKSKLPFLMQEILCDFIFRIIELKLTSSQMFGFCGIALVLR